MKPVAKLSFLLALSLTAHLPAYAAGMDMSNMDMPSAAQGKAAATEAVGVVDEVNAAKGTVTISHEPIKSLGWSAMTMEFVVKDKKILAKLSKGKKVHFTFVEQGDDYLITKVK